MSTNADLFTEEVHDIVVELGSWLKAQNLHPDKLMPALAVVLGRVMSHQASNDVELRTMLEMATNTITAAALEDWDSRTRTPTPSH